MTGFGEILRKGEILTYNIDTTPGQSGSPVFLIIEDHLIEIYLIGIHVAGDPFENKYNMGTYLN